MAIRARADNLSLDVATSDPIAPVRDFAEVWAQRDALRQTCVRMIGDAARAEDLVQETFVSALKCSGRLHEGQSVAPWLKTVARRRSIDELRGRDRVALMASPPEPASTFSDDPADHVISQELVSELRRAIEDLSPRERQLLLRQASYGLSLAELAAEEQTSVASVRSVLSRARQKLRGSLERGGVFGGLPLPRVLATLRERMFRWGLHLEPALPAVTGAGSRLGEVVAAVVTALALLLTGGARGADQGSLLNAGLALASGESTGVGAKPLRSTGGDGSSGSAFGPAAPRSLPQSSPLAPLPPEVGEQKLPSDGITAPEKATITTFAASSDGQVILAGGTTGIHRTLETLFRSTDGGATWHRLGDGSVNQLEGHRTYPGGHIFVPKNFPDDPRVFSVERGAVHRSDNGGLTFTPIAPAVGNVVASPKLGAGDDRLFVTGPPAAAYDDKLLGMRPLAPNAPLNTNASIAIGPTFDTTGELLFTGATTSGATSTRVVLSCMATGCTTRGVVDASGIHRLFTSPLSPNRVFVWTTSPYVGRSVDGGRTFTRLPFSDQFTPVGMAAVSDNVLYMYGSNPWRNQAPLYRSDDGGTTWTPLGAGSAVHNGIMALLPLPNGRLIAAYKTSGVYCSDDGGHTWARRCPPL